MLCCCMFLKELFKVKEKNTFIVMRICTFLHVFMDSMLGFYKYKNLDLRQIFKGTMSNSHLLTKFNFVDVDESSLLTFMNAPLDS